MASTLIDFLKLSTCNVMETPSSSALDNFHAGLSVIKPMMAVDVEIISKKIVLKQLYEVKMPITSSMPLPCSVLILIRDVIVISRKVFLVLLEVHLMRATNFCYNAASIEVKLGKLNCEFFTLDNARF